MPRVVAAVGVAAALLLAVMVATTYGQSPDCLGCLCQASSQCNVTVGCSSHRGYHCGPFLISWSFWKDAGQPLLVAGDNPDRKGAFEDCANDVYCSSDTVVLYLKKFEQDCTGDGKITCMDYALLHKVGGYGCRAPRPQNPYFVALDICLATVNEV